MRSTHARTMRSPGWWVLGVILMPVALSGQGAVVQVVDSSGVPIPFAIVAISGGTSRLVDSTGQVRFTGLKGNNLKLRVQRMGYTPFDGAVTVDDGVFRVVLVRITQELEEVRVIAERNTPLSRNGFYDRMLRVQRGAIVGEFITPEELNQRRPMQVSNILTGRRYVTVRREGARGRATLAGRGGQCGMTILVDGQRMNGVLQPGQGGGYRGDMNLTIDELVEAGSVAAIEIYASMANAPAELIPLTGGGSCGIIAVWTGGRQ